MRQKRLDEAAVRSVEILAMALEQLGDVPDVELAYLRNALAEVLASRRPEAVEVAMALFGRIDPVIRRKLDQDARTLASSQRGHYSRSRVPLRVARVAR